MSAPIVHAVPPSGYYFSCGVWKPRDIKAGSKAWVAPIATSKTEVIPSIGMPVAPDDVITPSPRPVDREKIQQYWQQKHSQCISEASQQQPQRKTPAVDGEAKKEPMSKHRNKHEKHKKSRDRSASGRRHGKRTGPASSPGPAVGGSPGSVHKKVLQLLAELQPAQAAAELVQPGAPSQAANSIQPLAELQHVVLMRRRRTCIRTRLRLPFQKTSVQPLALAENQTVKVIPLTSSDGVDRVHGADEERSCAQRHSQLNHQLHRQPR